ncbi:hypothetical protein BGZ76_001917, partial [Entomortierella beljakovae]
MFTHVYPAWHKPAQRGFFVVAAILCITLPAIYGSSHKPRKISATAMGTLVVRFLVPSPTIESNLPRYNPSPYPEPIALHTPSRADAVPAIPAIRLKSPTATATSESKVAKGARFGDEDVSVLSPPIRQNTVKFQARPQESTSSVNAYPTYADYRQSQHGNFEAFAQRVKRAFLTSQQQQREEEMRQQEIQSMDESSVDFKSMAPTLSINTTEKDTASGRRLSVSASSVLSDIAGKIRASSIFGRSQTLLPLRSSTEPQLDDQSQISIGQVPSNINVPEIPAVGLRSVSSAQQLQQQQNKNNRVDPEDSEEESLTSLSKIKPRSIENA